jgi:Carboxypeptidase regulatory-like domain
MTTRILRRAAVGIAALGLFAPPRLSSAAEPQAPERPTASAPATAIMDVALAAGGVFSGQLVDPQGRPQSGSSVELLQQQQTVATTTTDQDGRFSIPGLQGGMYQVVAGQEMRLYRLWAPDTAPPGARQSVMLVAAGQVVRGQRGWRYWLTNPWVISGAVAAAIAVPIALANRDKVTTS